MPKNQEQHKIIQMSLTERGLSPGRLLGREVVGLLDIGRQPGGCLAQRHGGGGGGADRCVVS